MRCSVARSPGRRIYNLGAKMASEAVQLHKVTPRCRAQPVFIACLGLGQLVSADRGWNSRESSLETWAPKRESPTAGPGKGKFLNSHVARCTNTGGWTGTAAYLTLES